MTNPDEILTRLVAIAEDCAGLAERGHRVVVGKKKLKNGTLAYAVRVLPIEARRGGRTRAGGKR